MVPVSPKGARAPFTPVIRLGKFTGHGLYKSRYIQAGITMNQEMNVVARKAITVLINPGTLQSRSQQVAVSITVLTEFQ